MEHDDLTLPNLGQASIPRARVPVDPVLGSDSSGLLDATEPFLDAEPLLDADAPEPASASTLLDAGAPLPARVEAAEELLYYCLTDLEHQAGRLAAEAEAANKPHQALRAQLIASDAASRMGELDRAKEWQLRLHEEAGSGTALERRVQVMLSTTCDRRGERSESIRWIRLATADWPEQDHPAWRAEALMIFALMSISRRHVDYTLARHAVEAVEAHCSPLLLSVTLANFAEVAAECRDLEVATEFADAALATLHRHPEVTAPLTLDSIAQARLATGQTEAAIGLLRTALRLEARLGCSDVQGDPWLSLAEALLIQDDATGSLALLDDPRRAAWAGKSTWTRSRDWKQRALVLARLERWPEAFAALLEHTAVYEAVRTIESDRVTAESETLQIATEERHRAERFEQLALTDPLTGLPNRRQVDRWLAATEVTRHVAIVDLDHFKRVNDTYSHAAGDLVLQRVAEALQAAMFTVARDGGGSRVARLGGEEFVVVWTGVHPDTVKNHAERLLDRLRATAFPEIDPELQITASIGLAFDRPHMTGSLLLSEADRRLYSAKRNGRNQVTYADPA
jgi:diguanylate cyclase (GGDEF)-like protein